MKASLFVRTRSIPFGSIQIPRPKFGGLAGLVGILLFFAVWETAPRLGLVNEIFVPPFSQVVDAFAKLLVSGELARHASASLQRAFTGLAVAIVVAVPLGLAMGRLRAVERFVDPLLQSFRQTSALALFPVFLLLFGIGEVSKVAIVFWAAQWAILLNTISGARNVDPILTKSAKTLGASPTDVFRKVVLPAAIPSIFTGIRLSATTSLVVLIAAEMLGAKAGLGFLIYYSENTYKIPQMYAAIASLSLFGIVLNYLLVGLERRIGRWKDGLSHA